METIHYILDNWDYLLTPDAAASVAGGAGGWPSAIIIGVPLGI